MYKKQTRPTCISYSQNFLVSPKLVSLILECTTIGKNDLVIEIGAGKGALTKPLAQLCKQLIGVELDENLYKALKEDLIAQKNVTLIWKDFINFNLPTTLEYKVVGNIPFCISTQIIKKLLNAPNPPAESYLIVQKEFALRFTQVSFISLCYWPVANFKIQKYFKPNDFSPRPKVDTVLLQITKRDKPLLDPSLRPILLDFLAYNFLSREKSVLKVFKSLFTYNQIKTLQRTYNISKEDTLTTLSFQTWLDIFQTFRQISTEKQLKLINGAYQRLVKKQMKLEKIYQTRSRR